MRIVLDTNVTISGLLWDGPPRRMLEAARAETITLYTCIELLDEVAEVLQRPKLIARLNHIGKSPQELIDEYQALVALVSIDLLPHTVSTDPDDDVVLACALAAQAHVIVSGDLICSSLQCSRVYRS